MTNPIASYLETLELAAPIIHGRLAMYPLLAPNDRAPDYLTLDEAMAAGHCQVEEVTESGHVNRLRHLNDGHLPVLLLDGDRLVGARQNRVLNLTLLAAGKARTDLPVSCVEQGRWSYRVARRFNMADLALGAELRAVKAASVAASRRKRHTDDADQHAIWHRIHAKTKRMHLHAPTQDVAALYAAKQDKLDGIVSNFEAQPRQVGALFTLDGRVLGLDLFDSQHTLARVLPRLARGYALEVLDPLQCQQPANALTIDAFLERLRTAVPAMHASIVFGEDARIDTDTVGASALIHDGRVLHLFADPTPIEADVYAP